MAGLDVRTGNKIMENEYSSAPAFLCQYFGIFAAYVHCTHFYCLQIAGNPSGEGARRL